jgi:spermidine/putrescine transport system permease protein
MPGVAWLVLLFLVPFYGVLAVAFGDVDPFFGNAVPVWNPLRWDFTSFGDVLDRVLTGALGAVFIRTFVYVGAALVIAFLIGYPVAYYVSRQAGKRRGLLLALLLAPFWINYLMRMLAWINLLSPNGWGTRFLHATGIEWLFIQLGLLSTAGGWLDGEPTTVILALVYGYIPFLILPLFAALDRIDQRQIEAARDLGASPFSAFRRVTLPLSMPGILAGVVLIALPMFGDYYTPDLVSASTKTTLIGNQIDQLTRQGSEKVTGAVLTMLLAAMLLLLMLYYLRLTRRAGEEEAA